MAEGPKYNGTDGGPLDLATSRAWVDKYKAQNPGKTVAHYFGKDIISSILSETGCTGIRIYNAINDEGSSQLLIVGVDSKGNNILPGTELGGGNQIADFSFPCPPYCGEGGDNI